MIKALKGLLIFLLITTIASEVLIYSLNKRDIIRIYTPSYNFNQPFWSDINEVFGVWHSPDSEFVHTSPCFELKYQANNHGMRDKDRQKEGFGKRFIVIGDSFVEGFGVSRNDRFTDLLEDELSNEFLNFGTSGVFGLTQAALLYETFASDFYHTDLIISVLPFNDFSDDDINYGKSYYKNRYRPYLVGENKDYQIEYVRKNMSRGRNEDKLHRKIMSFFREYTFTYNFMVMIRDNLFVNVDKENLEKLKKISLEMYTDQWSGYHDINSIHLNKMLWALNKISRKANSLNKNVYLFVIPTKQDISRLEKDKDLSKLQSYLRSELPLLNIKYIPLTEKFVERSQKTNDIETFFHTCDDHWNSKGNYFAKEIIKNSLIQ